MTTYRDILSKTLPKEPDSSLYFRILARIKKEENKSTRIQLVISGLITISSIAALVPTTTYLVSEFANSGIGQYLSLLSSDGGSMLSFWKEFSLVVVESLPTLGIALILLVLLVLSISLIALIKTLRKANYKLQTTQ
ncbi:MAG: hypothetical protein WCW14_01600 [Candidatus Paceibacterota bacterium]|jgi:hypothetical protein